MCCVVGRIPRLACAGLVVISRLNITASVVWWVADFCVRRFHKIGDLGPGIFREIGIEFCVGSLRVDMSWDEVMRVLAGRRRQALVKPKLKGHNPVCPFCEQHTRGVRRAYFNSASTMTCSSELFIANSDSSLLFGN
jgi:hypothetical protein